MTLSKSDHQEIEAIIGRKPSKIEETIFDTMWSEHCSYKSTKPVLKTLPTKGSEVTLGVGEDSGIIHFTEHEGRRYGIAVSHESHNHPSQILPVEGAATGVGGVVRDVYCMGAEVFGVLNSLHFGVNEDGNSSHVEEIEAGVIEGVSEYGNALGVPMLGGETLYHPSYNDNCLVNVAALGLIAEDDIVHSYVPKEAATEPFDVILFGKSTDATGFGGASFSSAILDVEDEVQNMGAVQVHDPFLKRVLAEAIKELPKVLKGIPWGFKDLGAGGISCAAPELAIGGGFGIKLNLDNVNVAIEGLPPEVIACSETQERFCVVVPRTATASVIKLFNEDFEMPNLYHKAGAAVIGEVTTDDRFVITYKGEAICDLPVAAITTEVKAERTAEPRVIQREGAEAPRVDIAQVQALAIAQLAQKFNASKRYVYRNFDNAVRGDTVVYPGEADAVVVTPIEGCDAAVAVSMDSNIYGEADPYVSGAAAVAEAVRNVVAVGARPITVTDCLNYG
ncbi:phosphoribosylformylglycinamidine synthase, partial [bacterium]|nr:phosphoribosylformylglycinamidine synthase [bacterium]